jgi:hypothetical protein
MAPCPKKRWSCLGSRSLAGIRTFGIDDAIKATSLRNAFYKMHAV